MNLKINIDFFAHLGFWLGFLAKAVGYTIFLKLWFHEPFKKSAGIAVARAVLGALVALVALTSLPPHLPFAAVYSLLIIFKAMEWMVIAQASYRNRLARGLVSYLVVATLVSCALDALALMGWISTEGMIC